MSRILVARIYLTDDADDEWVERIMDALEDLCPCLTGGDHAIEMVSVSPGEELEDD